MSVQFEPSWDQWLPNAAFNIRFERYIALEAAKVWLRISTDWLPTGEGASCEHLLKAPELN